MTAHCVKKADSMVKKLSCRCMSEAIMNKNYNDFCTPFLGQSLANKAETVNPLKFAVAILLDDDIFGHLPKTISFFLQADARNVCTVMVMGKAVNLGDKKGMQVPCNLCFSGVRPFLQRLCRELAMMEL